MEVEGGTLSVDDTILDKPYSQEGKTELVGYFWSGKQGRAVKGICLVTLLYTDLKGRPGQTGGNSGRAQCAGQRRPPDFAGSTACSPPDQSPPRSSENATSGQ